jgi:hypothetical protein
MFLMGLLPQGGKLTNSIGGISDAYMQQKFGVWLNC